jgi:hypothetical protein
LSEAEEDGVEAEEWTGERLRAHRQALAARRARTAQAGRLFAVALVLTVGAGVAFRVSEEWWVPAVGALAILAVLFRLANWKCPSCGERLPGRSRRAQCLGCGAPLD